MRSYACSSEASGNQSMVSMICDSIIDILISIFYLHWNQSYEIMDDKYIVK